jgi:sugar phosphate isomerase/epimerase
MQRHFEICRDFGFHWLEFGIGGGQTGRLPEAPTEQDIDAFRAIGTRFGIETPFCCLENDFTLPDAADQEKMLEKTLAQIRAAAACGATHVRLFAGFTPVTELNDEIWDRLFDAFARCDALCAQLSMQIAIETHGAIEFDPQGAAIHSHTASTHPPAIRRLLEGLPTRVGFNYDPGNLKPLAEGDKLLRLDLIDSRINYCHLKDWRRSGDGWVACAIGDDDLDYGPIFDRMSFDGVYLIEYEPLEDPLKGIERSLDYLKRTVDRVDLGG